MAFIPRTNNTSKNLFFDSEFKFSVDQDSDTLSSAKFIYWDEGLTGSGVIERQISPVLSQGIKGSPIKIIAGASGGGTYIEQYIWFCNFPELKFTDKISIGVWIKSDTASSARLDIDFMDRNNATPGQLSSGTNFTSSTNSTTGGYELLKIENVSIPIVGNWSGVTEVPFAIRVRLKALVNGSTVEFAEPMANIGNILLPYQASIFDYSNFTGIENIANKVFNKTNIEINVLGDSISRNTDTSQTATSAASYSTLIKQFLDTKFGITTTKRNNGFDGSADCNSIAVMDKMCLTHNPDLVILANGRNVNSATSLGSVAENYTLRESLIRRIRNQSLYTDIINFLPTYKRLESGGLTDANYYQFQRDRLTIENNRYLNNRYRCATLYSADAIKVFGDKGGWWNIFGNNSVSGTEVTHPGQMGHRCMLDQFKHLLIGSYLNNKQILHYPIASIGYINDGTLVTDLESIVTIYPDQFANGTYSGVTVTTTGTWTADTNMVSDGRLCGTTGYLGNTGLGEYPQPMMTQALGDAIQLDWTGRNFGIWFLKSNNRGIATITIDGTPYDFDTNQASAGVVTNSYPSYCTFLSSNNPNSISLTEGAHTLKIEQKNSAANSNVSIAMIVLF
jgi:hypothetical protein